MLRSLLMNSKRRRYHCDRCRVLLDVNMIYSTYSAFHVVIFTVMYRAMGNACMT